MSNLIKRLVACAVIMITLLAAFPANGSYAAASHTVRYTVLGDSLTDYAMYAGKDWTTYPCYTERILEKNNDVNLYVKNYAVSGFLTSDVLSQINNNPDVIKNLKKSDVVTILIGGNDLIQAVTCGLNDYGYSMDSFYGEDAEQAMAVAISVLGNKKNSYHKIYISSLEEKIREIVTLIEAYNPNCEIAIATYYYNEAKAVEWFETMFNADETAIGLLGEAFGIAVKEMQTQFKRVANENGNVTYVDTNEMFDADYFQYDSNGKYLDFHPNYKGQLKLTDIFIKAFWNKFDLNNVSGLVSASEYYSFYAQNDSLHSAANANMGDCNTIWISANGTGSKLISTSETYSREFSTVIRPAKASGVVTGFSLWDNSNKSEILIRFEGTDTDSLVVCAGGCGQYITEQIALGFDASAKEHSYKVFFDNNQLIVTIDGNKKTVIDISNINSPVAAVTPVIFIEKATWAGTFANKKAVSIFKYVK